MDDNEAVKGKCPVWGDWWSVHSRLRLTFGGKETK